jgi:hypothetical protein
LNPVDPKLARSWFQSTLERVKKVKSWFSSLCFHRFNLYRRYNEEATGKGGRVTARRSAANAALAKVGLYTFNPVDP